MIEPEIRINNAYASCLKSVYEDNDEHKESTPIVRQSLLTTSKYLEKMQNLFTQTTEPNILPPNCRYLETLNGHTLVVIEEPPAYRTITVDSSFDNDLHLLGDEKLKKYNIDKYFYIGNANRPFKFTLALPYVIFIILISDKNELSAGRVYFRKSRMIGLGDSLYLAPLMNISNSNYICFGSGNVPRGLTINRTIEETIGKFWSSTFNTDYTCNYNAYNNVQYVNTYIEWQAMSKINPLFIYQVDWIDTHKTISNSIDNIKNNYYLHEKNSIHFQTLEDLFTRPIKMKGSGAPSEDKAMFYDVAQSLSLSNDIYVSIGDSFMWGANLVYLDSLIGHRTGIEKLRLNLPNGKYINVKNNKSVRNYVLNAIRKLRYETHGVMKNGVVIKENDIVIIELNGRNFYRKVGPIRKNMDGLIEGKLGKDFFILENIEGKIFNIEKDIYYDGLKMDIGNNYILVETQKTPFNKLARLSKFTGFNITDGSMNTIVMEFVTREDDRYNIELNMETLKPRRDNVRLFDVKTLETLPSVFMIGTHIFSYKVIGGSRQPFVLKTPDCIISDLDFSDVDQMTFGEILENILINDGNTFQVNGFDLTINFSIGDRVVVADWLNPENMLIPKTIMGFKVDRENETIDFILQDRNNNITPVRYFTRTVGRHVTYNIKVGKIRKIVSQYNNVLAGTKIKSKTGHVPQFPKKNVNIIIGFITDTGIDEPLVLCSNCCTLWFNDCIRDFDFIPMTSPKWKKMDHVAVDISTIKLQPGDILSSTDDKITYLLTNRPGYRLGFGYLNLNQYHQGPYINHFDNYVRDRSKLDCIINPRASKIELERAMNFKGTYNLHGVYCESRTSYLNFKANGRIRMNVQNTHQQ